MAFTWVGGFTDNVFVTYARGLALGGLRERLICSDPAKAPVAVAVDFAEELLDLPATVQCSKGERWGEVPPLPGRMGLRGEPGRIPPVEYEANHYRATMEYQAKATR
ncbi:hypothetical protein ACWEFL_33580 [Streptomyces sp. NPDC004838]